MKVSLGCYFVYSLLTLLSRVTSYRLLGQYHKLISHIEIWAYNFGDLKRGSSACDRLRQKSIRSTYHWVGRCEGCKKQNNEAGVEFHSCRIRLVYVRV